MEIGIRRELSGGYDQAVTRVAQVLEKEGFALLSDIDVKRTLQQKLGVEFRRYRIFGVWNATLAHETLLQNLSVGLLMPCNVVVYEDDQGRAVVAAADPLQTAALQAGPELEALARSTRKRLMRVIEHI